LVGPASYCRGMFSVVATSQLCLTVVIEQDTAFQSSVSTVSSAFTPSTFTQSWNVPNMNEFYRKSLRLTFLRAAYHEKQNNKQTQECN
jgi:hypothetical protein